MKHITQLNVFFDKEPLGRLSYHNRQWWFQYDPHWLENGFNLAPQLLSFDFTPQLAKLPIFEGLHSIFYDSLPDGWGMNNEHNTAINGAGNPTRQDIAKVAAEHGILPWEQIVAEVLAAVEQWPSVANKNKVNKGNVKKIATMMAQVRKCIE